MTNLGNLNPILTGLATQYAQDIKGFVADKIAPVFNSPSKTGTFYRQKTDNFLNFPENIKRQAGSDAARIGARFDSDSFATEEYVLESPVDDSEVAMYGSQFDADSVALKRVLMALMVNRERRTAKLAYNAAVPSVTILPANTWDLATSAPIAVIETAKLAIKAACGMYPTTLTMPDNVFLALRNHPTILDRIKYTQLGVTTEQLMAAVFGVNELIVASGTVNVANDGQPVSVGRIWGKNVVLSVKAEGQDLEALNFLRTFNWTGYGASPYKVVSYREERASSWIHKAGHSLVEKQLSSLAGYAILNVIP